MNHARPPSHAQQSQCSIEGVRRVAVIGCGLIGARWAALFMAAGLDVVASDPAPGAFKRMLDDISLAWPALQRLKLTDLQEPPAPAFAPSLEEAVAEVDWIQENVPDQEALKLAVVAEIDRASPVSAIIASSTSGILPTLLQSRCEHPERVLVGHPFNPVHIMPLVEVVAGKSTSPAVVERSLAFYAAIGKNPLSVRRETPGFVANRIQEAILREAFYLVSEGVATTADIDAAISNGPGLRLPLFGPCMVNHLGGGRGGMAYSLEHFDPEEAADWSIAPPPAMTEELKRRLIDGTADQAKVKSLVEWEALRDEFLIHLLELKNQLL